MFQDNLLVSVSYVQRASVVRVVRVVVTTYFRWLPVASRGFSQMLQFNGHDGEIHRVSPEPVSCWSSGLS